MNDMDTIDRAWRDGFEHSAPAIDNAGVRNRVDRRVVKRRHRRVAGRVVLAVCALLLIAGTSLALRPKSKAEPAAPVHKVAVVDAPSGNLSIVFSSTGSSQIALAPGSYAFEVTNGSPGHELSLEGTGFTVEHASPRGETLVAKLAPGTYRLDCVIPRHAAAGESATIVVK